MPPSLPARDPSGERLQREDISLGQAARDDHLHDLPETLIVPRHGWAPLQAGELWHHRELLLLLVQRNIKIRYKQTGLGIAWAVVQPLVTMVVFTLVFGRLADLSSEGSPYPLFTLAAIVPWLYFSNALTQASTSLVENERLVTRIYFPRLLIPLASVLAGLLDFAVAFVILVLMMLAYGIHPTVRCWRRPSSLFWPWVPHSPPRHGCLPSTSSTGTSDTSFSSVSRAGCS